MTTLTNISNAVYKSADLNVVDVDIDTVEFGIIPTTIIVDNTDDEPHVLTIKQWLIDNQSLIADFVPYVETAADILKAKKAARDLALSELVYDFGDGRIIQTRPKDEQNIRNAIEIMTANSLTSIDWVMIDDVKYPVSIADLQAALQSGQGQALTVWNNFTP